VRIKEKKNYSKNGVQLKLANKSLTLEEKYSQSNEYSLNKVVR
jgi:hypothetical protein